MKYPKTIFVKLEKEDNNHTYLVAEKEIDEVENGKVAIYELKKIVTKETKVIIKE